MIFGKDKKKKSKAISFSDEGALQESFVAAAQECNEKLKAFYDNIAFNEKVLSEILKAGRFQVALKDRPATDDLMNKLPATQEFKSAMRKVGVEIGRVRYDYTGNGYSMIIEASPTEETIEKVTPTALLEHKEAEVLEDATALRSQAPAEPLAIIK